MGKKKRETRQKTGNKFYWMDASKNSYKISYTILLLEAAKLRVKD